MKRTFKITIDLRYNTDREIYEYFSRYPKVIRAVKIREALLHYLRHHGDDRRLFDTILGERIGTATSAVSTSGEKTQNVDLPEISQPSTENHADSKECRNIMQNEPDDLEEKVTKLINNL